MFLIFGFMEVSGNIFSTKISRFTVYSMYVYIVCMYIYVYTCRGMYMYVNAICMDSDKMVATE